MPTDTQRAAEPPTAAEPTSVPLLLPAKQAAALCGRSVATWWRLHAAGNVPAPVKLGGGTLWRAEELRDWARAGCPDRRTWEALQAAQHNGRLGWAGR